MVGIGTTVGCNGEEINLPPKGDDKVQASHEQALQSQQETIIRLENLNENSPKELWERFFKQRGSLDCWKELSVASDQENERLEFFFCRFKEPSITISEQDQVDQVTLGIVKYLVCHQVPVKTLRVIGDNFNHRFKISFLPNEVANLNSLKELDISYNGLKDVEQFLAVLCNLPSLKKLCLGNNLITELPAEMANLENLEEIDLTKNQLKVFPDVLCKLPNLTTVKLNDNLIKELPLELANLSKLKKIYLCNNQFETVPAILCNLLSLKELYLSNNLITELPTKISDLKLEQFWIDDNKLTRLPSSLLTYLENKSLVLMMGENPWIWLDDRIEESKHLKPIDIKELKKAAYARFPRSLKVICMQCIEEKLQPRQHKEIDQYLPEGLQHEDRVQLIRQAYHLEDKNIVFFCQIRKDDCYNNGIFPFYMDHPLATQKDVTHMLEEVEGLLEDAEEGQLYKVVAECPIYTEEQNTEDFMSVGGEGQPCSNM